jgi:hypothetical protein
MCTGVPDNSNCSLIGILDGEGKLPVLTAQQVVDLEQLKKRCPRALNTKLMLVGRIFMDDIAVMLPAGIKCTPGVDIGGSFEREGATKEENSTAWHRIVYLFDYTEEVDYISYCRFLEQFLGHKQLRAAEFRFLDDIVYGLQGERKLSHFKKEDDELSKRMIQFFSTLA